MEWELDHKEGRMPKNWCFWTVVLEKTVESPLDCKEIKPVNPKGNKFWKFIGRTDAKAETPILWPPDAKNWFVGKDPDAGKGWRWEEKGMTEDYMDGWHPQLDGHEFEQALGDGEGQGILVRPMASQSVGRDWATEQQQQTMRGYSQCARVRMEFFLWFRSYFDKILKNCFRNSEETNVDQYSLVPLKCINKNLNHQPFWFWTRWNDLMP